MFKAATGEAPHGFLQRRRMERAKRLLIETQMPVAELALACGFSSQSHFTVSFRKHVGLTPSKYRAAVG
jgi:AraC family transcriptional regulator